MADSKKQRRIRWGVTGLILGVTLVLLILAFFIPGLQIVAIAMGLSAALAPAVMAGIGVIAAVLWNAAFALVSWLMTRNEPPEVNVIEDLNAKQPASYLPSSPQPTSSPTPSAPIFEASKDKNAKIV